MQAAVFKGAGVLALEDVPEPVVEADDDVVIEVEACGICGSDLQILNVPPGHPADPGVILGHEFIGRIRALGRGGGTLQVGQRVVVDPDPKCGTCGPCRAGRPASCENVRALGVFRHGALAPLVKAPAEFVFPLSEGPSSAIASLIEPLACVVTGVNRADPRPGESAVIFGAGAIGCLFLAMFKAAGASPVIVVEPQAARGAVAMAVGADLVVSPEELAAQRRELLPHGADVIVDAVGSQLGTAIEHAGLGGRIVLFGMNQTARPPIQQYTITERSLSVLGSYITAFTFPTAIRLVEGGMLPLDPIVTHVLPLERVSEGLDLLRSGVATKVVITPGAAPVT
ncbi:MAG: alcohol dehydrogenase catalytic domain-containing protein [Chloroflexi bacterium]|nr:alcohol dehydrogenase catalytic domain-containing protein [Chloroflexota bacterium]